MVIDLNNIKLPKFHRFRIIKQNNWYIAQRRDYFIFWTSITKYSDRYINSTKCVNPLYKLASIEEAELRILEYKRDEIIMKQNKTFIKEIK